MKHTFDSPPQTSPPPDKQGGYGLAAWELEFLVDELELLDDFSPNIDSEEKAISVEKMSKFVVEQALINADTVKPRPERPLTPEEVWLTYEGNIIIEPASNEVNIDAESTVARLETDHVVKQTPKFTEQMQQADRDNRLTYLSGEYKSYGSAASEEEYQFRRQEITEADALRELHGFLSNVSQDENLSQRRRDMAAAMIENLAFIGKKEYLEATQGIATYWKELLDTNPDLQIYAVAGEIAKSYDLNAIKGSKEETFVTKSDEYILDNILKQFSDEELQKYAGRLVLSEQDVNVEKPEDLRVVLLDDWTISGEQLREARERFLKRYPDFEKSIEVQLIVASEKRIKDGLSLSSVGKSGKTSVPIRSYYLAPSDKFSEFGARITGFHSSVDFDFEDVLEFMVEDKAENSDDVTMPAPANLVRPYRMDNRLPNIDRFNRINQPK